MSGNRRALLVGIDCYLDEPLSGCVADAEELAEMLARDYDGEPNWVTTTVLGRKYGVIDRDGLREEMLELFSNSAGLDLLFFFAGHGAQTAWGAELVTQDGFGVSMSDLITLVNDSPARSVTVILDCCFSGNIGDVHDAAAVAESFRLAKTLLRENVTVMTASRATQTSSEGAGHGDFTRVLLEGLGGGAGDHSGRVSALGLYSFVSRTFNAAEQRPVLKANLTEPLILRRGPPWIADRLLRELPDHFSSKAKLRLSPAHEGKGRPKVRREDMTRKMLEFDYLAELRNAGLVTTDDNEALYWVAMRSGYVYLTPLGKYFWRLAKSGRV